MVRRRAVAPARTGRLRDVAARRPRLLLVGINPSLRSAEVGHHFAGKANPFWRLLYDARMTPEALTAEQDRRLAGIGIALTNMCPRATRAAAELSRAELEAGCARLVRKCAQLEPRVVAFVGISLYAAFARWQARTSGAKRARSPGGPGAKPERIGAARIFVVPNPSGLNASFPGYQSKLVWFRALRRFVERHAVRAGRG